MNFNSKKSEKKKVILTKENYYYFWIFLGLITIVIFIWNLKTNTNLEFFHSIDNNNSPVWKKDYSQFPESIGKAKGPKHKILNRVLLRKYLFYGMSPEMQKGMEILGLTPDFVYYTFVTQGDWLTLDFLYSTNHFRGPKVAQVFYYLKDVVFEEVDVKAVIKDFNPRNPHHCHFFDLEYNFRFWRFMREVRSHC